MRSAGLFVDNMRFISTAAFLGLGILCSTSLGCKKTAEAQAGSGPAVFSASEKNGVSSAIEAKKYDTALEALAKLREKVTTDKGVDEYRALLNETMTQLRILSGDDENARAAFATLTKMATGR